MDSPVTGIGYPVQSVISALVAALKTLLDPRMLALVLWPMLAAIALWLVAALTFWGSWAGGLAAMVQATPLQHWIAQGFLAALSHYLIDALLVLLLLPAIYVTALAITAVFAMPMMVNHVAGRYYPALERRHGGSASGSIANAAIAIAVYCAGWVLSLPLWLFSPFALVLPVLLTAWLNQRLFRYDALAEHAGSAEYRQLVERCAVKLNLLGVAVGVLQFVPLLGLLLPVYAGLAFIHLCLAELKQLRQPA